MVMEAPEMPELKGVEGETVSLCFWLEDYCWDTGVLCIWLMIDHFQMEYLTSIYDLT